MAIIQPTHQQNIEEYSSVTIEAIGDIQERIGRYFTRSEPRRRFMAYLIGLLSEVKRKNGCSLAEYAQEITPDGMQRLLTTAKWDAGAIRDELHAYIKDWFGDQQAVIVVGEAAFAKRGRHSAGVKKQFNEGSQRVENCQIGMFLGYATPRGTLLTDRELYVPEEWRNDWDRRSRAGIPETAFATRVTLAIRMVARAVGSGLPMGWVSTSELADIGAALHERLLAKHIPHIVEIRPSAAVQYTRGSRLIRASARDLLGPASNPQWQPIWPHGQLWSRVLLRGDTSGQTAVWLVARAARHGVPEQQYVAAGPATASLAELARAVQASAGIKCALARAKEQVGLDHYEARRYEAWYRHVTLALFADALLQAHALPRGDSQNGQVVTQTTHGMQDKGVQERCLHLRTTPAAISLAR
jgi:SRSO17 transposase